MSTHHHTHFHFPPAEGGGGPCLHHIHLELKRMSDVLADIQAAVVEVRQAEADVLARLGVLVATVASQAASIKSLTEQLAADGIDPAAVAAIAVELHAVAAELEAGAAAATPADPVPAPVEVPVETPVEGGA
jgi:hypothetical protein